MKIRATLPVSDDARRCIALNLKAAGSPCVTTENGMATRATVIQWLEFVLYAASASYNPTPKIDPTARAETALAVNQLRALGWSDFRIRAWLLKQSALMEGAKLNLWEEPLLTTQPAVAVDNPTLPA